MKTPSVAKFSLGINYWPRRSAMYMWKRFDAGEVRDELALIASLGLDLVRFFLLWEDFQPAPDTIDKTMLARLEIVMDAMSEAKLMAMPTLFTGHMSGVNWLPQWTLDPLAPAGRFRTISGGKSVPFGVGDIYREPLLAAQELQARAVGERLRDHPALHMWDLGNEFSNIREPLIPQDAATWSRTLTDALFETSNRPVCAGTHGEDITRDRGIRLSSLAAPSPVANMHGYSVYSAFARTRTDTEVVPFLSQIAQSCAGKPVLFSEFGNPTCPPGKLSPYDRVPLPDEDVPLVSSIPASEAAAYACLTETEMSDYAYTVLDKLQQRGAVGAYWWCFADYAGEVTELPPYDRAPHELSFGIVRQDGSLKPVAETLRKFAGEHRDIAALPKPIVNEAEYYEHFPEVVEETYERYLKSWKS